MFSYGNSNKIQSAVLLQQTLQPCRGGHHCAEARLLHDQNRFMQAFRRHRAGVISVIKRTGSIGEEFHGIASVKSLAGGCIAAHLRHVAGNDQRRYRLLFQPCFQTSAGEAAGQAFLQQDGIFTFGDLRVQMPALAAFDEGRGIRPRSGVLNNDHRNFVQIRFIHRFGNIRQTAGRISNG